MVVGLHAADFMVLYMGEASVSVGSVMLFDFGKMWKLFFRQSVRDVCYWTKQGKNLKWEEEGPSRLPSSRTMPITITTHDESSAAAGMEGCQGRTKDCASMRVVWTLSFLIR